MPPEEPKKAESNKPFDAELRKDLGKLVVMFVPTFIMGIMTAYLNKARFNRPDVAVMIILSGIVIMVLLLLRVTIRNKLKLGWPFLVFLSIYLLTFSFAAYTSVLDWKRTLVGHEEEVPQNFLALNSIGDWHYKFVSRKPALEKLVIVLMKPPESKQEGRSDIANLLAIAQTSGAVGVALDSYFEQYLLEKGEEEEGIDDLLCQRFDQVRKAGLRVFVAHDFKVTDEHIDRVPMDPDLAKCVPESDQGHLMGYAERDGVIRSIPLYLWNDDPTSEALSLKIARAPNPNFGVPNRQLLQFTSPRNDFRRIPFETLDDPDQDNKILDDRRSVLNGRFILAGENSAQDRFQTPFREQPGVIIHAYAVQSLIQNSFIVRLAWLSFFLIPVWCYLLMVLTARGVGNLKLILINAAASVFVAGLAALAMWFGLWWIDLIYPLLAAWLFLLLLIALRKTALRKMSALIR